MTMKIELSDEHLAVLIRVLPQHPYGMVAPVIDAINRQVREHRTEKVVPPKLVKDADK